MEMSAKTFDSYGKALSSLPGLGPGEALPQEGNQALAMKVEDLSNRADT